MKKPCFLLALSFGLFISSINSVLSIAALPSANELPDLVEKILPGVVNISSTTLTRTQVYGMDDFFRYWGIPQERKQSSLGSGFIIDENEGLVLTNNHVVSHATEVLVSLIDKKVYNAKIIGKDQKLDLALLKIIDKSTQKTPENLTRVPMGDSDLVRIAESVFAVGNPFSLQHSVTVGIISAKNRTIGIGPFDNFLQTDASINPGNSGGPLFNFKGEVIGINTAIYSQTGQSGGLGFAIPVNEAKRVLEDLKKYGRVPRPWLGILGERITPSLEHYYGLSANKGVLVYDLAPRGPAGQGSIRVGDIISSIEGTETLDTQAVERVLEKRRPKDKIKVTLQRGAKTLTLTLTLSELPPLDNLPQGII